MMKIISRICFWVSHRYSAGLMGGLFIIVFGFFWLFNFSHLPVSNSEFVKLSGQEGLLDTILFYSSQEAYTALIHYGEDGRRLYLGFLAADFIFIIFYSVAFAFLMTKTVFSVCGKRSSWLILNLLPFGIGFFDCVENICIFGMLKIYPLSSTILGTISGSATGCKWLLTMVVTFCLVYGGIRISLRRFGFRHCPASRQ